LHVTSDENVPTPAVPVVVVPEPAAPAVPIATDPVPAVAPTPVETSPRHPAASHAATRMRAEL
jgi:hypothetical protein